MSNKIALTRKQAAPLLAITFPHYRGRKIVLEFTEHVTLYNVNWNEGSRNTYLGLTATNGPKSLIVGAPWNHRLEGASVTLSKDGIVVSHSIFCGKDSGIRIYAHPDLAPSLLPAPGKESNNIT